MRVTVTASNVYGSSTARSTRTAVVAAAPATDTTAPSAPGGFQVTAVTQTSLATSWSPATDNVGVTGYTAFRNGAQIWQGPGTSYTFGGLACGTSYTLAVKAYDAAGNVSAATSASASTGACSTTTAPANTSPPIVSGTAQVGKVLTATNGSWSGTAPMTYADQWLDCDASGASCVAISGATTSSYTLVSSDQGHTVRARISASNSAGSSSASSAATSAVAAATATTGLTGIRVSGNKLVDGHGNAVLLHGVNYSGTEYACIQGWGIFDGPSDSTMVKAIASWHVNVVHIGLNEDCVLGINGVSSAYSGTNYLNAIVAFVNVLHANGMYAEVSLMWAAPGTQQALDHPAILDQDHAPAALQTIATTFKNDPNTIIGLQSEPHGIGWACWRSGGTSCSVGYAALGMQGALDAVRGTGATNVVTASGTSYANDLSQWLANKPSDPLVQLAAEAHVYGGNSCASTSCFNTNYAPVAAQVPLLWGETGETFDGSSCGSSNVSTFVPWAEAHGVGYEAWTWDTWGNCSSLIGSYSGTPANAYAQWLHDHLLATYP
jgi:endoglucanase